METPEIEISEIPEWLCNLCGETCKLPPLYEGYEHADGLIGAVASGGYASTAGNGYGALDDCTSYNFSLCEFCLDWLFSKFVIPVTLSDYMRGGVDGDIYEEFRPAMQRILEDQWRTSIGDFLSEFQKRNAARKV